MGTILHEAFVVTSWNKGKVQDAHRYASADPDVGHLVSPIINSTVNFFYSFFIAPDGSKQGWDDREKANAGRGRVIEWMKAQAYDDGSNCLEWCCVSFGHEAPTEAPHD